MIYTFTINQFIFISLLFGLLIGSFFNVIIHRFPLMLQRRWRRECELYLQEGPESINLPDVYNLTLPHSQCPHCHQPIKPYDNIPLLSYLWLRGKCRHCHFKISPRYPLVELITGLMTCFNLLFFSDPLECVAGIIFSYLLIIMSFIDIDHQIIPDEFTITGLWMGLLLNNYSIFCNLHEAVYGAVAGYLSLWSIYQLFKLATGKEGMGYGDFKLLAMMGAWLGYQQILPIILIASVFGSIVGLGLIAIKQQGKDIPFAFGPYLALAGLITCYYGNSLTHWYLNLIGVY